MSIVINYNYTLFVQYIKCRTSNQKVVGSGLPRCADSITFKSCVSIGSDSLLGIELTVYWLSADSNNKNMYYV